MFDPPLLNSATPWATTLADLRELYLSPHTGAVTTRTNTLHGFHHDPAVHQFCFFDSRNGSVQGTAPSADGLPAAVPGTAAVSSLNTLGYSPLPLSETLSNVEKVVGDSHGRMGGKAFILSVTGSPAELAECHAQIAALQRRIPHTPLYMETNLSCPNIAGRPPPSYSEEALTTYLRALAAFSSSAEGKAVKVGIKIPPYTNALEFGMLRRALLECSQSKPCIQFITATNTLGCCLVMDADGAALSSQDGTGIGGMAGAALHPLALGNVRILKSTVVSEERLRDVKIIGLGGVADASGYARMRSVGADAVAVGTALGRKGVGVFAEIWENVGKDGSG